MAVSASPPGECESPSSYPRATVELPAIPPSEPSRYAEGDPKGEGRPRRPALPPGRAMKETDR